MSQRPIAIKIICPSCENATELTHLKYLDITSADDEILRNDADLIQPKMTKVLYDDFRSMLGEHNSKISKTVARMKSHKTGRFNKQCRFSNKVFEVFNYFFVDHENQTGGTTFRIGKEIQDYDEIEKNAAWDSMYSEKTMKLSKKGFGIVMEYILEHTKHIIMSGDIAMYMQLAPDLRSPISCIEINYKKNEEKTKEFVLELGNQLLDSGENVQINDKGNMFTIESFKNNQWWPVVAVCPKGYVFR